MRERIKIGEFARIGQVSVATLRHYDQYDLLKPTELDAATGYRYYRLDQLPRLHRILTLKELGFSLEQIARLLNEEVSLEQLHGMFKLKQAQTQRMIDMEQTNLERIAVRLRQIEQEGRMPKYEVLLKEVDTLLVASMRETTPIGEDLHRLHKKLAAYLDEQHIQHSEPSILLLHSRYESRNDVLAIDVEAAVPLSTELPGNEQISIRTLSAGMVASTIHTGSDLAIGQAYAALYRWMNDHKYRIVGFPRLLYLHYGEHMDSGVTEVQFLVEKQLVTAV